MEKTNVNISLVGVGGQGILLVSHLVAAAAMREGFDVKKSEVHGMSQRGGSVTSQVRFGEKVFSPILCDGESDILVAFERTEALRHAGLVKPTGRVLVNDMDIVPVGVSMGSVPPAENLDARVAALPGVMRIAALPLALEAGNARCANVVLAGALASWLPMARESWEEAIRARLPEKLHAVNLKAFDLGFAAASGEAK
ncbi:MAG: indolepyruvate oxidoreductase subunit beta [Kiritimatiellae bacterium]|nr:indolepyruvate oxidoreductase subunit beta [Kiritimatiellia bacterium]